jgi:hypothetical protein
MRWRSFIPTKLPPKIATAAKGPGDAMLKFIGEAVKSETANGYRPGATSWELVPKRKRKHLR